MHHIYIGSYIPVTYHATAIPAWQHEPRESLPSTASNCVCVCVCVRACVRGVAPVNNY
jgi:hypothetical protein